MVKNKGRKSKPIGKNKKRPPQGQRSRPPQNRQQANRKRAYSPSPEERKRQAIRKKKLKRRRKIIFYSSFLIVIIITFVTLCFTVFFKVETIEVTGKSIYDKDTIIRISDIKKNDNMLRISKKKTAEKICTSLPYIGNVKISYRLPNTIGIAVYGTSDKMVYRSGKSYVTTNENGKVLDISSKVNDSNLLEIKGVIVKKAKIGYPIELKDAKSSENIKLICDGFEKNNIKDINFIDFKDSSNIKSMYQNRIEIWFGSCSNMDKKMQFINKILEKENERSLEQKGVIDLQYIKSEENENQKAYFRPEDATTKVQTTAEKEDKKQET